MSLSGERYADQEYAFGFQKAYDPACHSQLKTGIMALAERYRNAPPVTKPGKVLPTISTTQPSDSVESLDAIEVSSVDVPKEDQGEAVPSIEANRPVRLVGDAYYSKLFDLARPEPAKHEWRRRRSGTGHSLPVHTAVTDAAAENAASATLVSIPGLPLSSGAFVRSQEMREMRIDYLVHAVSGYLGYHWLARTLCELLP